MKTLFYYWLLAVSFIGSAQAQTNVIFPELLSSTNDVLMTNAEYRCLAGNKIFFKNEAGYKSFHAADLNSNVLEQLHITAAQLEANQQKQDANEAKYKASLAKYQAAKALYLQQSAVAAKQNAAAQRALDASWSKYLNENPDVMRSGGNFLGQ